MHGFHICVEWLRRRRETGGRREIAGLLERYLTRADERACAGEKGAELIAHRLVLEVIGDSDAESLDAAAERLEVGHRARNQAFAAGQRLDLLAYGFPLHGIAGE